MKAGKPGKPGGKRESQRRAEAGPKRAAAPSPPISADLATFVETGVSIQVGTRDHRLFPECVRAFGARVEPGRREVTVFVPVATGATTVANLADNGLVAVCFSRIEDHRSMQLKGKVTSLGPAGAADRAVVERYRGAFAKCIGFIGVPPRISMRMNAWPCHAVRFAVESLFVQTPGPGAGAPLSAGAASPT